MNAFGLLPLVIATIGAAFASLVLRGHARRDNRLFGALALVDAAMEGWRGLNLVSGGAIDSPGVLMPCSLGTILLAILTIELMASFPRRPPLAWRWRGPVLAWSVAALALSQISIPGPWGERTAIEVGYFIPITTIGVAVCAVAFRRTTQHDVRIVIGMIGFRWLWGLTAYSIVPLIGGFDTALWAESLIAVPLCHAVIGATVIRTELFGLRSVTVEIVTIVSIATAIMLATGIAIWGAVVHLEPGPVQGAALLGTTLIPLGLATLAWQLYPRVERRVLAGLDERRARRLGVQGEPLPADAVAAITEATQRIAAFGDGSSARWVPAAELPAKLATLLREGPLRAEEQPDLPASFIVPAPGVDGELVGAFYITGGTIDRDTYLVARDLAARVALSVERAQAVDALDDARRLAALGQFAAAIAHDIRTPLTSISMNVQILRRKLQLPDDDREHLDIALEELARLDRSVAEILDFAKPVRLAAEEIDVAELLEDATRRLAPVLSERGVALRCEPAGDLVVHGDPLRLRQVLTNLVGNAADASKPGAEITVRAAAANDGHVSIEVEDRGRGIGAADLPRIFEPFFTTRPDGTGLGLAICHKVVRAHGGDIRVRSTPGEGSTFTVVLPAA